MAEARRKFDEDNPICEDLRVREAQCMLGCDVVTVMARSQNSSRHTFCGDAKRVPAGEQLSRPVDREFLIPSYDQSSNGSLILSPWRNAASSAGSWPG